MDATTTWLCDRAALTSERCPSCSAPMVGTNPSDFPDRRISRQVACISATVLTVLISYSLTNSKARGQKAVFVLPFALSLLPLLASFRTSVEVHEFRSYFSVRRNRVHRESQLRTEWAPASSWRDVPCKSSGVEHTPRVPMASQHIIDSQLSEDIFLALAEVTIHRPIRLGVTRESPVPLVRNMLYRNGHPAARVATAIFILVLAFVLASIRSATSAALAFQPSQHLLPFAACLLRHWGLLVSVKIVPIAQELGVQRVYGHVF